MFSVNRLLVILGLGTLLGAALLAYGLRGPLYATEPLLASFSLAETTTQEFSFRTGRTATYFVELHLTEALTESEMEYILGDFVAGGGGALDVVWSIATDGTVVAEGSNELYGYSPIFGDGMSGVAIGKFEAHRGRDYVLALASRSGDPSWDRCEPAVEIGLHPSDLEYLIGYVLIGGSVILLFGLLFLSLLGVAVYRSLLRRASSSAEARHLTSA